MSFKRFFQKKFLLFYFSILSFTMLLVANFVIGFYNNQTKELITLKEIGNLINFLYLRKLKISNYLKTSYFLLICGLLSISITVIGLLLNLFSIQAFTTRKIILYWIVLITIFLSFILTIAGQLIYVSNEAKLHFGAKITEIYDLKWLIILITITSFFTLLLGFLVYVWKLEFFGVKTRN